MANKYQKTIVSLWIVMLITILNLGLHASVEGLRTLDKRDFRPKPKGTLKTIEVPEDGDIIDCVDIYKQPGLDNPLIKDERIQMEPSSNSLPSFNNKNNDLYPELIQNWRKYGECPKGTVPIRRDRNYNGTINHHRAHNDNDRSDHEYAKLELAGNGTRYYGVTANLNVWNPRVTNETEFSLGQVWITSEYGGMLNAIEVGWMVNRVIYSDEKTRLFTYWTSDNYQTTRCYDDRCYGFIYASEDHILGGTLHPYSLYNQRDRQYHISVSLFRDHVIGNWWLYVQDKKIGYFDRNIFTSLHYGASKIQLGGEIRNIREGGHHTRTEMGSGHFPSEGYGNASYISNIQVQDEHNRRYVDANFRQWTGLVSRPTCYDVKLGPHGTAFSSHFYFGGPGGNSPMCP